MRVWALSTMILLSAPALAESDELRPIAAVSLIGKPYVGAGAASEIQFVNTRRSAIQLNWIAFDGTMKSYAVIPPGGEILQPTFVSHRWLITRYGGGAPLEAFISTRADVHSDGQAQIAVIR